MNWIKRMFEDAQGIPDEARVLGTLIVLSFVVLSLHTYIFTGEVFKPQDWGLGVGAMSAGIGAWFGFRKDN